MKKLLGIVVLGLLFLGNAYASCLDDVDMEVSQPNRYILEIDFELLNNKGKSIEITEVKISTADNETIKSIEPYDYILKPFGRAVIKMSIADINKNVWKKSGFSCRYK
mgnify:CR=1 FL=1